MAGTESRAGNNEGMSNNLVAFLGVLAGIFIVASVIFFSQSYGRLTGYASEGGAPVTQIPAPQPSGEPTNGGSGGGGGEEPSKQVISSETNEVFFANPSVRVKAFSVIPLSEDDAVSVTEPQQGAAVAGIGPRWRMQINVPELREPGAFNIRLPHGSSYVQVSGPSPQVVIQTLRVPGDPLTFFQRIFFSQASEELVSVDISNAVRGNYQVSFSTSPVIVQEEPLTRGDKRLTVRNSGSTSYKSVSVVTTLKNVAEPSEIKVKSSSGKEVMFSYYENERNEVIVSFEADVEKRSKETFNIHAPGTKARSEAGEGEASASQALPAISGISGECAGSYVCEVSTPCSPEYETADVLTGEGLLDGVTRSICRSDNAKCPSIVSKREKCSLSRDVSVRADEENKVSVYGTDNEKIASLNVVEDVEGASRVDVVFVQGEEALEVSCRNGVLDEGEGGIDCGGTCRRCVKSTLNYFAVVSFALFFVIAFVVFYRARRGV